MTATLREVPRGVRPVIYVSPRERSVLDAFMHDGGGNNVVARRCNLKEDTVKTHMRSIFRKTVTALNAGVGTMDRTALAVALCRNRLGVRTCHSPVFHDLQLYARVPEGHRCDRPAKW